MPRKKVSSVTSPAPASRAATLRGHRRGAQAVGQDRYYGQAVYLPPGWKYHNQNVTFQQWSPEKPEGPWLLMFVQNNQIRFGGSDVISGGAVEVWVNGKKAAGSVGSTAGGGLRGRRVIT